MSDDPLANSKDPQLPIWPLKFNAILEDQYRKLTIESNHKQVAMTWIVGLVLYDLFIISDFFASEDYFFLFLVGRFLIATPLCLLIIVLIWRKSALYDFMVIACSLVMTAVLTGLIMMTDGTFRLDYLFGNILLMVCGSVIGRPRTIVSFPVIVLQVICYIFALQSMDHIHTSTRVVSVLFCFGGAVIAFLVSYGLEQISRRSFILGLRVSRLNQELERQSLTDPLTHLANRRAFEQATTRHWSDLSLRSRPVSLVLIDIDRFKLFNDSYGHSAGDLCLKRVAQSIRSVMPIGPSLAVRFGGEEIVLFLPETDFTRARALAEEVRLSILREAIPHPAQTINGVVSASFGVATTTAGECDAAELVIRADSALYAAKKNGRNQVWPPLRIEAGDRRPTVELMAHAG